MFRLFKHYISYAVLFLALLDAVALLAAAELAWTIRARQIGMAVLPFQARWMPAVIFMLVVQLGMVAVGVYSPEALQSRRFALMRLMAAVSLAVILLATLYFLFPGVAFWRSNLINA